MRTKSDVNTNEAEMQSQEYEKLEWRHPHGMDVLKRLGIIERSNASISEGDDDLDESIRMKKEDMLALKDDIQNSGEFINDDSDDNEFIFDRASLLRGRNSSDEDRNTTWFNNRRTRNMAESRRIFCCRGFLAALAYFIVGLCMSLFGPTLGNLPALSNPYSGLTSVISANALGAMLGVILCAGCNTLLNTFCIMMLALPLCSITTLVVPWCTTLTGATMVFMLQGVSFGFVERGCYSVFHAYWRRRHSVLILFYVALSLGATISPLIASSFFVWKPSANSSSDDAAPSTALSRVGRNIGDINVTMVFASCNGSDTDNCTMAVNETSVSTSAPHPKKPSVIDATGLDHKKTKTEQKEEALKGKDETKAPQLQSGAVSGNANVTYIANSSSAITTLTTPTLTTTTSTTSTSKTTATTTTTVTTTTTTATTTLATSTLPAVTKTTTVSPATTAAANAETTPETVPSYSSATTPETTFSGQTWEQMKKELIRMNSYQLAYVTVASISIVLTLLYSLICCFTPCRKQGASPNGTSTSDYKLQLTGLFKSRSNLYATFTAAAFAFFLVSLESVLTNLLTIYGVTVDASRLHSGIMATSIFWLCASVARIVAACFHGRLTQTIPMASCLGVALFSAGVVVVFGYWTVVWMVVSILGFCYGCLYPLAYCWLDQQLTPGPWFSTIWCLSGQLARMVAPFCASAAMFNHSTKDFLFAILVIVLFTCLVFVLMRSTVREAARLINVEQQQRVTCKVKFGGGDALFEYHHFNNFEGNVERENDDEVTYFDRSRDARQANGGTAPLFELNPKKIDRHF